MSDEPYVLAEDLRSEVAKLQAALRLALGRAEAERAANERLRALLTHANLCAIIRGHVYVTNATIEETASAILAAVLASDKAEGPTTEADPIHRAFVHSDDSWSCSCGASGYKERPWGHLGIPPSHHQGWHLAAPTTEVDGA